MEIAKMNLEDLENIKDDLQEKYDDFWNYNILKKELLDENSIYFVIKDNKEIIGFAGVQFIIDEASITNIVVKKNRRGNGIGTLMLKQIIEYSQKKDISTITLEVNEKNIIAIGLYKKMGFEIVGARKNYYNGRDMAYLMTKIM